MTTEQEQEAIDMLRHILEEVGEISRSTERNSEKIDGIGQTVERIDKRLGVVETSVALIEKRHARENGAHEKGIQIKASLSWWVAIISGVIALVLLLDKLLEFIRP